MPGDFEVIEHTADMALRVRGATLDELFEAGARGLARLLSPTGDIASTEEHSFELESASLERLLVVFLSELVYLHETREMLFSGFDVTVSGPGADGGYGVRATARGEPFDRERHLLDSPVKAVTQHMLAVDRTDDGWEATIVMDT
jgi:SHS2 domain-containing protein